VLALPHRQACLDGFLEHIEPLTRPLGKREPKPRSLLWVVAGPDAEHRAAAGQDVEGGHHLGQQARRTVGGGGGEGQQPHPPGVRGDVGERRVSLEVVLERATDDRMHPDVVGDRDEVESGLVCCAHDLGQEAAQPRGTALPARFDDVHAELHLVTTLRPELDANVGIVVCG
jgi:hypothetical protein